jgi:transposase InsO family protein
MDAPAPSGQRVALPEWLRPFPLIRDEIARIAADALTPGEADILIRLATDERMKKVWTLLKSRKRQTRTADRREQAGGFLYPAQQPPDAIDRTADENQEAAMAETLLFAFRAAADGVSVKKEHEVLQKKEELLTKARILYESASEIPDEAEGLRRVAAIYETAAAKVRTVDDPLTIKKNRGDAVTRGVQIVIANFFRERFGTNLDPTAATLTTVALDLKKPASERASRSRLLKTKMG